MNLMTFWEIKMDFFELVRIFSGFSISVFAIFVASSKYRENDIQRAIFWAIVASVVSICEAIRFS